MCHLNVHILQVSLTSSQVCKEESIPVQPGEHFTDCNGDGNSLFHMNLLPISNNEVEEGSTHLFLILLPDSSPSWESFIKTLPKSKILPPAASLYLKHKQNFLFQDSHPRSYLYKTTVLQNTKLDPVTWMIHYYDGF